MFFKEQLLSSSQYNIQKLSNKLFVWGLNTSGQVGPVLYLFSLAQISAGASHIVALTSDNRLLTWGQNTSGQLGTGDTLNRSFPTQIAPSGWKRVRAGQSHTVAIRGDGELFTWGNNAAGQLGLNNTINRSSPTQVNLGNLNDASAGASFTIVLSSSNTLYAWGVNNFGQLGDSTTISKSSPVQIGTDSWLLLASGTEHTLAVRTDFALYGWGLNGDGQLGSPQYSWASIAGGRASHSAAIRSDGLLFTWGLNNAGQLGDATTITKSAPIQIGTSSWSQITVGSSFSIARRIDNSLFGWGLNTNGQVGDNTTISKSSPILIGSGISWSNVSAGQNYALATQQSTLILYGWGLNSSSQLGNNQVINRSSPTVISWNPIMIDGSTNALPLTFVLSAAPIVTPVPFNNIPATVANNGISLALNLNTTAAGAAPDQVTTPSVAGFNIGGVTNYTVECWVYVLALNNVQIYSLGTANFSAWTNFGINTSGAVYFIHSASGGWAWTGNLTSATGQIVINTWYHLAFVKQGSSCVIYRNGSSIASGTLSIPNGQSGTLFIGSYFGNSNGDNSYLRGYISNFRMVSGTAVYTSGPFTPPTSPLSAISGTTLFLTNEGIEENVPSFTQLSAGNTASYGIDVLGGLYSWGNNNIGQLGLNNNVTRRFPLQIGSSSWTQVSGGSSYALAISSTGLLFAWGGNESYNLGDGTTINKSSPVQIGSNSYSLVSAGDVHSLARDTSGLLYGWGNNEFGQLGINQTPDGTYRQLVMNAFDRGAYIKSDNTLWVWGANANGQVGDGTTIYRSSPTQIPGSWSQVSLAFLHTAAINSSGSIFCWGRNASGELGDNTTTDKSSPVQLFASAGQIYLQVSAGGNSGGTNMAILQNSPNNLLYGWGQNSDDQWGTGNTASRSQTTLARTGAGSTTGWSFVHVAGNANSSYAIRGDRTLVVAGNNGNGQLGTGTTTNTAGTVLAGSWLMVHSVANNAYGIRTNNTLFAWGFNSSGQVGDGTTISKSSPVQVAGSWLSVNAGTVGNPLAIRSDNLMFGWGLGPFGDGTTISRSSPIQIGAGQTWNDLTFGNRDRGIVTGGAIDSNSYIWMWRFAGPPIILPMNVQRSAPTLLAFQNSVPTQIGTSSWTQVNASNNFTSTLTPTSELRMWGTNFTGQLGNNQTIARTEPSQLRQTLITAPVQIFTGSWGAISAGNNYSLAINGVSELYGWGLNSSGQLGINNTVSRSSGVQVLAGTSFIRVGAGFNHAGAIATDSTLYMWGNNATFQLGDQTTISKSSPVLTTTGSWALIALGNGITVATNNNKLLYTWGSGAAGISADGTTITRSSPTLVSFTQTISQSSPIQIGAESWTFISSGNNYFVALRSDSLLYGWGNNANGQLGINDTINRSSPVLIGTSSWIAVSAAGGSAGINQVLAIRSDRRLFGWGINANGMLPIGLQGSSWDAIASSGSHTVAIRSDSSLWAWGLNNAGQLGLGNTINRSSPVQIGVANIWSKVAVGASHSLALAGTFEVYSFGLNNVGQLGLSNTINRSSPVQVGSAQYTEIAAGLSFSSAVEFFGTLRTWGLNSSGQLGDNTTINKSTPTQLASPFNSTVLYRITAGGTHMGGIDPNTQNVYMWGLNSSGQLGIGSTINRSNPTILGGAALTVTDVSSFATILTNNFTNFTTSVVPIAGSVSGVFNGSSSYINASTGSQFNMGTGDFTIECWLNSAATSYANSGVALAFGAYTNEPTITISLFSDGFNIVQTPAGTTSGNALTQFSTTKFISNTWYHVAVVKQSGILRAYINGVFTGSTFNDTSTYNPSIFGLRIGCSASFTGNNAPFYFFNGRISNVRVVKGVAVYTGNFTLPTSIFATTQSAGTNISAIIGTQTSLLTYTTQAATIVGGQQIYAGTQNNALSAGATQSFLIDDQSLLYAWGLNTGGQLGSSDAFNRSAPAQIGASSWTQVFAERAVGNGALATTADGRLFAWGGLTSQNLIGDGSTLTRSSPVQVTAWAANRLNNVSVAGTNIGIVRDDSLLYIWGPNLTGVVGDGTTIYKSTPTQIGPTVTATSSPVQIGFASNWDKVSLGISTAAAINTNGQLYLWGSDNQFGTLGANTTIKRLVPTTPLDTSSWTQVSSGNYHVLAITSDRRMFAWGLNTAFRLGDNTSVNKSSPVQIGVGSSWNAVAAGNNHSLAIRLDGSLFAWGQNDAGQLGIIIEPQLWTQISTGESAALAIRADGLLYGWGLNTSGQLGDGTVGTKSSPTQIGTSSWTQVSSNFSNTVAIRSDGTLWSWGAGNILLGDGTVIAKSSPVQIGNSSWSQVSVGFSHVLAIDALGRLYGWGIATALNASTVAFSWTTVSENNSHVAAIRSDGLLFVWGLNSSGQVGNNNVVSQSSPIQIGNSSWISVGAGFDHTLAVTSDYRLFAWGNNTRYQIGDNTSINKSSPVQIGTGASWTQVTAGTSYSMAITTNNELYGWGLGASGQTGALTQPRIWNNVDAGFSTSAAVRSDNVLFVWGLNSSGQVGDSTLINRSSPVQVPALPTSMPTSWNAVSTGFDHTLGVTSTGALYGWGNPLSGATGNYGELYSWNMVAAAGDNWFGIRSDGSLWSSGSNLRGALGVNDTIARSSPVQVGSSSYIFVNAGGAPNFGVVMAITTDNRLFGWGYNELGNLGLNDVINRSSPTQIDVGNIYSYAAPYNHSFMIRTNGTLWTTGFNSSEGRLGLNDVINRSSPTQIGSGTYIKAFATDTHSLALRSDNTLWTWGQGTTNQLGINSAINRSSPVQVTSPGASPWIDIAGGFLYSVGVTGAGLGTPYSVYVWGGNNNGATGLNTTVGNNPLPVLMKAGAVGNSFVQVTTNPSAGASTPNTFILSSNGQMWSMGWLQGLGDNTLVSKSSPVLVFGSTSWSQLPKTAADLTQSAIATNSTLWAWGNVNSLTYVPGAALQSSPVQVGGNIRWGSYTFPLYAIQSTAGQGSWTGVAAGQSFSFGIKNNLLYGWGRNDLGQTGTNQTTTPLLSPIQIGTSSWNSVSASLGGNFAGGIRSDNLLFMWGSGFAELALPSNTSTYSWVQVSCGWTHVVGIKSDGSLWAWGGNANGQIGNNTTVTQSSPIQIGTSSWLQVACGGANTYAIRIDGTLWAWGSSLNGQLGDGTTVNKSNPVQIGTSSWAMVAAGGQATAYGILSNGGLYSWGNNNVGQLGITSVSPGGDIISRSSPTLVTSTLSWTSVFAGGRVVGAIKTDFSLWMWGENGTGALGNNTGALVSRSSPVQVTGNWKQLCVVGGYAGSNATIAIRTDNTLWGWGTNATNGDLRNIQHSSPVQIGTSQWTQVASGGYSVQAFDADKRLFVWGRDFANGSLGLNENSITRSSPTLLPAPAGLSWSLLTPTSNNSTFEDVLNGFYFTVNKAIASDGNLYMWGSNRFYQIQNTFPPVGRSSPVLFAGNWVQSYPLYTYPFLLPGLPTYTSIPVQIGTSSWTQLSTGTSHSLAVRADGTLWGWGINANNQLGLGLDTITRSSPTQIGTSSWTAVAAGFDHSMAIRSDGTLWGWGNNIVGQVGTFTQPNSWTSVVTRGQSTIGIRLDGSLYAWGVGTSGQLGDNSVVSKSSPVLIDSGSWIFATTNVYHSAAIKSDGTLWLWGNNSQGQLGQNDVISRSSPVQVVGGGSWTQVALGNFYTVGLKVGGTAFAWGWNSQGFIGDNTTINKSSPVQCTGGQIFTQIESTQGSHSNNALGQIFGINNSGILYTWGANNGGISGGGNSQPARSNPTIFNSNAPWNTTTWSRVFAGEGWAYGIRTDGALYVWGQGRLELSVQNIAGSGTWTSPLPIDAGQSYALVAAAGSDTTAVFGVRTNGALYTSGWNNFGTQFTLSTGSVRSNFTLIDAGPFTNISFNMDETVVAFKSSNPNIPFYWGRGTTGSSGTGYLINRSSPTQIGNNPDINTLSPVQVASGSWSQVSAGVQYTLAEDTNSNIYAWGQDSTGQLGL